MIHTKLIRCCLCLCVFVLCAKAPAQPDAHATSESFRRSGYEYFWGVLQEEFDARSFEQVADTDRYRELIDIVVRTGATYAQPYQNSSFGLTELYPELLKLDEDPPLYVQYRYHSSQAQNGSESPDEAYREHADALVEVAKRMQRAGYPDYVTGATWIRAAEFYRDEGMEASPIAIEARGTGLDLLVQAASLDDVPAEYREFVAERLSKFGWKYSALSEHDQDLYCERLLTDARVDRWIANYAYGNRMMAHGWEARGDGWAQDVPPRQWALFEQHMRDAYTHLSRAWEIRPYWALAPERLINLSMGFQVDPVRDEHFWFAEATRSRFDQEDAFENYARSIMPRWGGSVGQMFALLDLVLERSADEPNLVYIAIEIMSEITWSEEDGRIALLNEEYLSAVTQMMREELAHPLGYKNVWQRRALLRTLALGHFMTGNMVVCAEMLKAGGGMTETVRYPWIETAEFTKYAPVFSTNASDEVIEAMRLDTQGELKPALKAYRHAIRTLRDEPASAEIVGDPEQVVEVLISRLERSVPHEPWHEKLWVQVGAVIAALLLGVLLITKRMAAAKAGRSSVVSARD